MSFVRSGLLVDKVQRSRGISRRLLWPSEISLVHPSTLSSKKFSNPTQSNAMLDRGDGNKDSVEMRRIQRLKSFGELFSIDDSLRLRRHIGRRS